MIRRELKRLGGLAAILVVAPWCAAEISVTKAADDQDESSWRIEAALKARSLLIDPIGGERAEIDAAQVPTGLLSPDGTKVVFIGSDPDRVAEGFSFDLFIATVDLDQPSGKSDVRRLTVNQHRPVSPVWLPNNRQVAFLGSPDDRSNASEVWIVDTEEGGGGARISTEDTERVSQLSTNANGEVAYVTFKSRDGKITLSDLILVKPGMTREGEEPDLDREVILEDQFISSYEFGPKGRYLAWSGIGSLHLLELSTGESDEIPLHGIHRQLVNHSVQSIAWQPNGELLALTCGFLGGIAVERGDVPPPRLFAADKIFLIPVDWRPAEEDLEFREDEPFPSPLVTDPAAEISPEVGDQSAPWWIREIPMRPLRLHWRSQVQ